MLFKRRIQGVVDALLVDIEPLKPLELVDIVEYGKVAGYTKEWLEIKADAIMTCAIFAAMQAEFDIAEVVELPELTPRRRLDERFLIHERTVLVAALNALARDLAHAGDERLEMAWRGLDLADIRNFDEIHRRRVATTPCAIGSGKNVFVSSRFAPKLLEQVRGAVLRAELTPVLSSWRFGVAPSKMEWSGLLSEVEKCDGGVIGLDVEATAEAGETSETLERALSPALLEFRAVEGRAPGRALVIARHDWVESVSARFPRATVFPIREDVMSGEEAVTLTRLLARNAWRGEA